jgi:hypothetical protein
MEFGPGFWGPIVATIVMLVGAGLACLMLLSSRRIAKARPSIAKRSTYGCGEEVNPEEVTADSEQFYSPIRRIFKPFYKYIQPGHSGKLNTYLLWVVIGFVVLMVAIALVLR